MMVGMIAQLMTFGDDAFGQFGVTLRFASNQEERGAGIVFAEKIKQRRRVLGMGTIIEREIDGLVVRRPARHHHRLRQPAQQLHLFGSKRHGRLDR